MCVQLQNAFVSKLTAWFYYYYINLLIISQGSSSQWGTPRKLEQPCMQRSSSIIELWIHQIKFQCWVLNLTICMNKTNSFACIQLHRVVGDGSIGMGPWVSTWSWFQLPNSSWWCFEHAQPLYQYFITSSVHCLVSPTILNPKP